jgi:Acyl-protein synthetase, LuxE
MKRPAIDEFLSLPPFELDAKRKAALFGRVMRAAFEHHLQKNLRFRILSKKQGFSLHAKIARLSEYPYLPVSLFKGEELISVPSRDIHTRLKSSATTGTPSTIPVDEITSRRQTIASAKVIAEYIGPHRRPFLILDEDPVHSDSSFISASSAATRGFLMFADTAGYFLIKQGEELGIDLPGLKRHLKNDETRRLELCLLGFTYILYTKVIKPLKESGAVFKLSRQSKVIHIGGWKKLESQKVSRETFLRDVHETLGIDEQNIFDFYGFTEQMGLIYGSKGSSSKTASLYSEIIIRDFQTLEPAEDGKIGLIQILSPLPHSYPGISVLTDDVGRITGRGTDKEGRWGTQFEILGRAQQSETRGCGDILGQIMDGPDE